MAAVTICSDFGVQENKVCHCFCCFLIYLSWTDGTRCHDLCLWMLSFKPALSLSSFTFIKRLLSSSSLSAIRVVSSAYLRLLIFLPAILIPACASRLQSRWSRKNALLVFVFSVIRINLLIKLKQTHKFAEQTYSYQGGSVGENDRLEV